jgi:hypothetical protein
MSRNYTCSVGWAATVSFLCLAFLAPERSAACSCICYYPTWGFVSGGGLIPSNSAGLLWWGEFEGSNGTDQALPVQIAGASGEPLPVEYELVSPRGRRIPRWMRSKPRRLWLFRPRDGFKIGKSYIFTTRPICQSVIGGYSGPISLEEQRISVTVSDQAAVSPAGPVTLKIGEPITDLLQVAAGLSCSAVVNAAQLPIEMDLPEAMRAFRDQLYFETIIDGTDRWGPSASLCTLVLPGASWRGKGVDLLFSSCGDMQLSFTPCEEGSGVEELLEDPAVRSKAGLAAGRHTVEMRASLPGTDVLAVTSKIEVELRCPEEPDNPR